MRALLLSAGPGDSWYGSEVFWAIVGAVVGALGVWAAFRSARPRRALHVALAWQMQPAGTNWEREAAEAARLTRRVVRDPHVATVTVVASGARDIARSAFDERPLELEFGVPVVAVLSALSEPGRDGVPDPALTVTDTTLRVGPALLARRHALLYTVLLDGPCYLKIRSELPDVTILGPTRRRVRFRWLLALTLGPSAAWPLVYAAGLAHATFVTGRFHPTLEPLLGVLAGLGFGCFMTGTFLAFTGVSGRESDIEIRNNFHRPAPQPPRLDTLTHDRR
ncbi:MULTISPECIES: hypothetical protein [Saccharothrix]|uniref:hypothetical protein n=1 Tax=Saccharothrix TaxID=2071 RepID=UPI0011615342|nr:hypothetical protein [Saccharothrix sp. CB00851]